MTTHLSYYLPPSHRHVCLWDFASVCAHVYVSYGAIFRGVAVGATFLPTIRRAHLGLRRQRRRCTRVNSHAMVVIFGTLVDVRPARPGNRIRSYVCTRLLAGITIMYDDYGDASKCTKIQQHIASLSIPLAKGRNRSGSTHEICPCVPFAAEKVFQVLHSPEYRLYISGENYPSDNFLGAL